MAGSTSGNLAVLFLYNRKINVSASGCANVNEYDYTSIIHCRVNSEIHEGAAMKNANNEFPSRKKSLLTFFYILYSTASFHV